MKDYLTIAIPKGRLGDSALIELNKIGLASYIDESSRKLIFEDEENNIKYMFVKPVDVITYVSNGVADIGIIGKDNIIEEQADVYELLDLKFGLCKFAVAGLKGNSRYLSDETIKVATKYPNVASTYFERKNQKIEIIKLNGSVELAPLVGLADVILDIVETGSTLKANGLEVFEEIMDISAKLISNKVSYYFKGKEIKQMINLLLSKQKETKNATNY
jgi:ATP phosphoribosyltransferase